MAIHKPAIEKVPPALRAGERWAEPYLLEWLKTCAVPVLCPGPAGSRAHTALQDSLSLAYMTILGKVRSGAYQSGNFSAFCIEVLKRCWWDERKRAQRHNYGLLPERLPAPARERPAGSFKATLDNDAEDALLHWVQARPALDRHILELSWQGYNLMEIAEYLGLAYGTTRNRASALRRSARAKARQPAA